MVLCCKSRSCGKREDNVHTCFASAKEGSPFKSNQNRTPDCLVVRVAMNVLEPERLEKSSKVVKSICPPK